MWIDAVLEPAALERYLDRAAVRAAGPVVVAIVDALDAGPALLLELDDATDPRQLDDGLIASFVIRIAEWASTQDAATNTAQPPEIYFASFGNARPAAIKLGHRAAAGTLLFLCVGSPEGGLASEDISVSGALIQLVLEESDEAAVLGDSAGIAIAAAPDLNADRDLRTALLVGRRGREIAKGEDGAMQLSRAARLNYSACVPAFRRTDEGRVEAHPW